MGYIIINILRKKGKNTPHQACSIVIIAFPSHLLKTQIQITFLFRTLYSRLGRKQLKILYLLKVATVRISSTRTIS